MAGCSRIARYPVAAGSANSSNAAHTKARASTTAAGRSRRASRTIGTCCAVCPGKSRREPGAELRGKSLPRRALQPFRPLEQLVEQAELFVGQLRRACFERLRLARPVRGCAREL